MAGGEESRRAAVAQPVVGTMKHIVEVKCTCQRDLQPHSPTMSNLSVGKVIEILEEEKCEAGVWRFRTVAGWSNLYVGDAGSAGNAYMKGTPVGTPVLRELKPEEVPLALAKARTDLGDVEAKVWAAHIEGLCKGEQKAAAKERKRAKTGAGAKDAGAGGQGLRAAYSARLSVALREIADPGGPFAKRLFNDAELLAMSVVDVRDGAVVYQE